MDEVRVAQLEVVNRATGRKHPDSPAVISVIKNESDRLADFLRHYREAGIEHFILIDNGSTDGSLDYLRRQPDVDLYLCDRPFIWPKKHGWITLAIMMSGRGRDTWYIYVDADEYIVFTGIGKRTFTDLHRQMGRLGISRVRGVLIDMYPEGPILQSTYQPQAPLIESYPFFDRSGYVEAKYKQIISRKGGPRQRAFGSANPAFRPEMTKYPLFKLKNNDVFANPHHIWPFHDNFKSPCYLGVLHFKFLPGLIERIKRAIDGNLYWDNSIEYRCYNATLSSHPALSLYCEISERYESPETLARHSLVEPVPWRL